MAGIYETQHLVVQYDIISSALHISICCISTPGPYSNQHSSHISIHLLRTGSLISAFFLPLSIPALSLIPLQLGRTTNFSPPPQESKRTDTGTTWVRLAKCRKNTNACAHHRPNLAEVAGLQHKPGRARPTGDLKVLAGAFWPSKRKLHPRSVPLSSSPPHDRHTLPPPTFLTLPGP